MSESDLTKSSKSSMPHHGAVVLAAITSGTNTTNPSILICARSPRQKGSKNYQNVLFANKQWNTIEPPNELLRG